MESEAATTLYLVGSTTLVLGAGASVGLGLASVEIGLDGLFSPGYSPGPSDALEAAAIGVGCAAGAIGLLLLGIAIHFDVESGERRRARDALSLRF